MTIQQLRLKHPRFIYKSYTVEEVADQIRITHEFVLEPDIVFRSTVSIPHPPSLRSGASGQAFSGRFESERFAPYAFHLGLIEAISYWKAAIPGELVVEAGALTPTQIRFWYDLFIHGLGEFFYRNDIDFTKPDFLRITSVKNEEKTVLTPKSTIIGNSPDLVLVGGGKDTAVSLGMLKNSGRTIQTMIVNPTPAALASVAASGLPAPIVITRVMDPKLMELNSQGYLNGHTPFSAYLAFLGLTVAGIYGNEYVIVSNERSANEGNVMYRGLEVNHQYSKSYRFEEAFRTYAADAFYEPASYFSLLRPLNDVQIGLLFASFPQYFGSFRSCNVGSKKNIWCGKCPKCAFTYLVLSPFLPQVTLVKIFGSDYFHDENILTHIRALVGLAPVKPFECVGTRDEAKLALLLMIKKCKEEAQEIPEGLLAIKSDLQITNEATVLLERVVLEEWGDTVNLPPEHLTILRHYWEKRLAEYRKKV